MCIRDRPFLDQASGLWLLVNRGWLPWPDRRVPVQFSTSERTLSLEAWVYVAPGATFQLHADPQGGNWPRLLTAIDARHLWPQLSREGFAYELRLEPGAASYRLDWPVVAMGPENTWATPCSGSPWRWRWSCSTSTSAGITTRRNSMGAVTSPLNMSEGKAPPGRARGRLQLILILLVVLGPMLLATAMYKLQFWVPDSRSYHGEMIGNGQSRADLGVSADEQRWQLLVSSPGDCGLDCQQLVYLARQIQIGLGRDASRASHALATAPALGADYQARLDREYPQLQRYPLDLSKYGEVSQGKQDAQLWIIDPHGNLVLRYNARVKGKDLLNDLRHLLKLSNIG